jgi:hypothetical protein
MKYIIILCGLGLILIVAVFLLEESVISKLPEDNKFKKWWRSRIIGVYKGNDF